MINLLPQEYKQSIKFGTINARLLKLTVALLAALMGLIIVIYGCLFYIKNDIKSHRSSIDNSKMVLNNQNEKETLSKVDDINNRLTLLVNVLSKEVVFSELLPHIGSLIPEGAVLNGLDLSRDSQNGLDLSISALDFETASQALANIKSSESLIFKDAEADNVNCNKKNDQLYPCEAVITATLVNDNPFMLLSNRGKK